jgi:hypothetical protein
MAPMIAGRLSARLVATSLNTIRTHMRNLYAKLGVHSRADAVKRAPRARAPRAVVAHAVIQAAVRSRRAGTQSSDLQLRPHRQSSSSACGES